MRGEACCVGAGAGAGTVVSLGIIGVGVCSGAGVDDILMLRAIVARLVGSTKVFKNTASLGG